MCCTLAAERSEVMLILLKYKPIRGEGGIRTHVSSKYTVNIDEDSEAYEATPL